MNIKVIHDYFARPFHDWISERTTPVRFLSVSVLGGILLLSLIGCGTIYRTDYLYTPPDSMEGRQCTIHCANIRELCRSRADARAGQEQSSCQQEIMMRYTVCVAAATNDEERVKCRSSTLHCRTRPDYQQCEIEYNFCYETCGGGVETRRVCVRGC